MGFCKVWIGSYIVKNIYDIMKSLNKMEQCSTFEGGGNFQFGVFKKKLCCLDFFNL